MKHENNRYREEELEEMEASGKEEEKLEENPREELSEVDSLKLKLEEKKLFIRKFYYGTLIHIIFILLIPQFVGIRVLIAVIL